MTFSTRRRRTPPTFSGLFSTCETVPTETPACAAISLTVGAFFSLPPYIALASLPPANILRQQLWRGRLHSERKGSSTGGRQSNRNEPDTTYITLTLASIGSDLASASWVWQHGSSDTNGHAFEACKRMDLVRGG